MDDNGRKSGSKRQCKHSDRPWWHSGSKCTAMLMWMFTLATAWRSTFDYNGWTRSSIVLLVFSLTLSIMTGCVAIASESRK